MHRVYQNEGVWKHYAESLGFKVVECSCELLECPKERLCGALYALDEESGAVVGIYKKAFKYGWLEDGR
jgi:hypothetical protein